MKPLSALVVVVALAALAEPALSPSAAASVSSTTASPAFSAAAEGDVTWSVRPGNAQSEDGRSWVEWDAAPGEEHTDHMVVTNHSATDVEFTLTAADGYFTDTGRFNMLPSDQESTDAGTWIDLPDSVIIPAGGATSVPFTVSVPLNASPGDHAAGVAATIHSTGEGGVGVESRVGFRVMTRVTGELQPGLALATSGSYGGEINPFEAGTIDLAYEVENTGNTRLRTQPEISISGPFGIGTQTVQGDEIVEIAPGETRQGVARFPAAWPLFVYDAHVSAEPLPVSEELSFDAAESTVTQANVVAMPWSQLVVLLMAAGLGLWAVMSRRRERQRTQRLVAQAREEALASVGAAGSRDTSESPMRPESVPVPASPPVSRRDARRAFGALAVAAALSAGLLSPAPEAFAATGDAEDGQGVDVTVAITARDSEVPGDGDDRCVGGPAAPAESRLTEQNRGALGSSDDLRVPQGGSLTLLLGTQYAGENVCGWLYPGPMTLGSTAVEADGSVSFTIPLDVPIGRHSLAITDDDGTILGWIEIEVTTASDESDVLPATGAEVPWAIGLGAAALLAAGSLMTARRRT